MTMKNRDEYIAYRFGRAWETLDDAKLLAEHGKWNSVVNRLYYASFYAVMAILLKHGIIAQTHDGTRTQFGLHFVKANKIDKSFGRLYTKLFDFRQKGDYGDMFDFDRDTVEPLIGQVEEFLQEVKKMM